MSQTVKGSVAEAWINILVGFSINYLMNAVVFAALLGRAVPWRANIAYGVVMTAVSFARGFALRRFFNSLAWGNR